MRTLLLSFFLISATQSPLWAAWPINPSSNIPSVQLCSVQQFRESSNSWESFKDYRMTILGKMELTSLARQGLDRLFELQRGPELVFQLLRQMGLILPVKEDRHYPVAKLFAEDEQVNAAAGHADPVIDRFLRYVHRHHPDSTKAGLLIDPSGVEWSILGQFFGRR